MTVPLIVSVSTPRPTSRAQKNVRTIKTAPKLDMCAWSLYHAPKATTHHIACITSVANANTKGSGRPLVANIEVRRISHAKATSFRIHQK